MEAPPGIAPLIRTPRSVCKPPLRRRIRTGCRAAQRCGARPNGGVTHQKNSTPDGVLTEALLACGLGHGSALKPHRGFIHYRTDPHRTGRFAPVSLWEQPLQKKSTRMGCDAEALLACGLGHGSALKPHWGFIHHRTDPHRTGRFAPGPMGESRIKKTALRMECCFFGGATRNRTGDEGFADPCLTAWPWRRIRYQKAADCRFFLSGAGNGARTRHLSLGKAALYQMSYSRRMVPQSGLEPPTQGFSVPCSTN